MMTTKIVCLVGSTKFKEAFEEANREESLLGAIVLSVGVFGHREHDFKMNSAVKRNLDRVYLEKIKMADEILVLNVGGYIGVGACDEIGYAWALGKRVRYLEERKGEHCEHCGQFVPGFEYQGCCDGRECGCMGMPIAPCICSDECWNKAFPHMKIEKPNMTLEEFSEEREHELDCIAAETGADREMDFDRERFEEEQYEKYLKTQPE